MNLKNAIYLHDNLNRIKEFRAEGMEYSFIAAAFQDQGFNLTGDQVRTLDESIGELSKKAYPKKAMKKAFQQRDLATRLMGLEERKPR